MLFGIVGNVLAQPATDACGDNQGGRYRLIAVNEGNSSRPYIIDVQTGRVWHQTYDSEKKQVVFTSSTYENISGELSTVPNETATSLVVKNSQPATSEPQKMDDKVSSADADLQFWQQQLANIKAGKQWASSPNGPPQPPSDSAAETVQLIIKRAQAQKDKQQ